MSDYVQDLHAEIGRLRKALEIIHEISQETNVPAWQTLQNIEATASQALVAGPQSKNLPPLRNAYRQPEAK